MIRKTDLFYLIMLFSISILNMSCASSNKNFRDAPGVLKTDTRSTSGVNK
jgi:hypothetical protein